MSYRLALARRHFGLIVPLLALIFALGPAPSPAGAIEDSAWRLVQLVNVERARVGLPPLAINSTLMNSAQSYAGVLASSRCWGHYCGPIPSPSDRARRAGYRGPFSVGENIAYGVNSPEAVFALWMNSYGHRANILNPNWTEIGVGVAWNNSTTHWTQTFGAGHVAPVAPVAPPPQLLPLFDPPPPTIRRPLPRCCTTDTGTRSAPVDDPEAPHSPPS